jgi:hypothetical protein
MHSTGASRPHPWASAASPGSGYVKKIGLFHGGERQAPGTLAAMSSSTDDTAPHRRLQDRGSGPPTIIGTGVSFRGDLIAPGSVLLSGSVRGDGDIGGTLQIARLYAVLCGNASRHVGMAGANGLAGRCLSLDMRR